MYEVYEANHVQEKRVEWRQTLSPMDNQNPTLAQVLEAADNEFHGISLDRLQLRATVDYDGIHHLPVVVLDVM